MKFSEEFRHILSSHSPRLIESDHRARAAVAVVLTLKGPAPQVLFIERAKHKDDPWSGDIGFPGGRLEAGDAGPMAAAERETFEEVGIILTRDEYAGRLDDIAGAHLPIVVSSFVYLLKDRPAVLPNKEVSRTFWVPLATLCDHRRQENLPVRFRGAELVRPAIRLPEDNSPPLWGITYRVVMSFLSLLGLCRGQARSTDH